MRFRTALADVGRMGILCVLLTLAIIVCIVGGLVDVIRPHQDRADWAFWVIAVCALVIIRVAVC